MLGCGPLSGRQGLRGFGRAPKIGHNHTHNLVWHFGLGLRIPTIWCQRPIGHAEVCVSLTPTQGATVRSGSSYPKLKGPNQSVGVLIHNSWRQMNRERGGRAAKKKVPVEVTIIFQP